jgi:inner membrane protein
MDNLTHSLFGAVLGQCGLKRKTGLAMPALIIGANLPDVDAACFFWLEGTEHLGFRRGITHGPPAMVLLPLILAGILYWYDRWQAGRGTRPEKRLPVSFKWLYILSLIGCLSHPALDWLNVYGVRLLEPFSSEWSYGDTLFIIDVWLWALLGWATWFSLRREKRPNAEDIEWIRPARIAMAAALAYIGLNGLITHQAEAALTSSPTGTDIVIASPPPVAFWRRDLISGGNGLYTENGETRPGVPLDRCDFSELRKTNSQVDAFLFWSRTPLIVPKEDGTYALRDARFMMEGQGGDNFTLPLSEVPCEGLTQ